MFDIREQPSVGPFWMGMTYRHVEGVSRKRRWWSKLRQWVRLRWVRVVAHFAVSTLTTGTLYIYH